MHFSPHFWQPLQCFKLKASTFLTQVAALPSMRECVPFAYVKPERFLMDVPRPLYLGWGEVIVSQVERLLQLSCPLGRREHGPDRRPVHHVAESRVGHGWSKVGILLEVEVGEVGLLKCKA